MLCRSLSRSLFQEALDWESVHRFSEPSANDDHVEAALVQPLILVHVAKTENVAQNPKPSRFAFCLGEEKGIRSLAGIQAWCCTHPDAFSSQLREIMDPEEARRCVDAGGTLLCMGVPAGTEMTFDLSSLVIGHKLRGIKMIPPGLHLLCWDAGRDRHATFLNFECSGVVVWRWSEVSA